MNEVIKCVLLIVALLIYTLFGGYDIGQAVEALRSGQYKRFGCCIMLAAMFLCFMAKAIFNM